MKSKGGTFFKDLRAHGDVLRQGVCASCIPHQEQLFTALVCVSLSALSQGSAEEGLGEQSQGTFSLREERPTEDHDICLARNAL